MYKAFLAVRNRGNCQRACDSWTTNSEIKFEGQKIYAFLGGRRGKEEVTEGFYAALNLRWPAALSHTVPSV